MKIIKKLDLYIIRGFLQLFAGTFFICLFILNMQFLFRWMDELIGKGLSTDILLKFFWYSSLTLVPMALPLAVLLASLISFGNLGERFELLSMKAAGIPLIRILQPLIILSLVICGCSFVFQNNVGPYATTELSRIAWSMRQKSPELQIPEGIFYSEIQGYNIYVKKKNIETGILYGIIIYTNAASYDDTQIVVADSGRLQGTEDKMHLKLTLWNGERFRNMDAQSGTMLRAGVPYMRESFIEEVDIITFDANFNLMDADEFKHNAQTKNLSAIRTGIDSLRSVVDSTGHAIFQNTMKTYLRKDLPVGIKDSMQIVREAEASAPFDSLYLELTDEQRVRAWSNARSKAQTMKSEYDFRALDTDNKNYMLRRHYIELYRKFTLSLACLLFFFIGAPLGAIIRKGGLGVPVVVSVLIFIAYYIINVSGENNAKTGEWTAESGIWLSTFVLLPAGIWLTYKANSDSTVFNVEGYRSFFMRLLGLRESRKLNRKEVIINDPDYAACRDELLSLAEDCNRYCQQHSLLRMPSYLRIYFRYEDDTHVMDIYERLEALIKQLHNTRDNFVLGVINQFPIIAPDAHTRPFHSARNNRIAGIVLPFGLFFWLRIWRYRLRLKRDMDSIEEHCRQIANRIETHILPEENEG